MSELPTVVITPEYIEKLLAGDIATYRLRGERAAMRAALGDAAALCDMLSIAALDQNRRRGRVTKAHREMSATFRRCGDEIWNMRFKINVPTQATEPDADYEAAAGQAGGGST